MRGVLVTCNTPDAFSVTFDVVEKSSILTGLIRWLTDAFDSVRNALSNLGSGIVDFLTGALQGIVDNAITIKDAIIGFLTGAFDSVIGLLTFLSDAIIEEIESAFELFSSVIERLVLLVSNLMSGLSDYLVDPLGPINDFLKSLDNSAISIWLKLFDLPIISDILMISVVFAILSGLVSFLKSGG